MSKKPILISHSFSSSGLSFCLVDEIYIDEANYELIKVDLAAPPLPPLAHTPMAMQGFRVNHLLREVRDIARDLKRPVRSSSGCNSWKCDLDIAQEELESKKRHEIDRIDRLLDQRGALQRNTPKVSLVHKPVRL
ncbi:TPA: hypothetical protein ACKP0F_000128 [Stenotrophomonas maltophilia]|jgi:hypothetical protein|uniref:hypothetical protein n=1 Tax=Stenotrophomonas TaxID=40323 RepID=UPI000A93191A|nr:MULTISPECIES: hypothetical protein [Stenotrophomonas]